MPEPKVIVGQDPRARRMLVPDEGTAWRWIGWIGLLLAFEGLADFGLAWIPLRFGVPEWEFATITATFSGLPLVTIGVAALLGSALALGKRWLLVLLAVFLTLFGLFIFATLTIFWTDVPIALRTVEGPVALGIRRAIVKTTVLGIGFGGSYLIGAFAALRHLRRGTR